MLFELEIYMLYDYLTSKNVSKRTGQALAQ